jgi:3-oxoacyl-[acyl-carrier protein] reductase
MHNAVAPMIDSGNKGRSMTKSEQMEHRTVVVTGASRGVGYETAKALALEHGCTVLAVGRDAVSLHQLKERCGAGKVEPVVLDIAHADAPTILVGAVAGRRIHAIVHNAGALLKADMGTYTAEALTSLYHINVIAPLLITQALAPLLGGDPPGHLLHIGSMGGFQDSSKFPGLASYSSSKAALACLSQCLAEEFRDQGIRSNCLALGAVDTAMLRAAFPGYTAPVGAEAMGAYVAHFSLEGHKLYNAKVLPVALGTP